jgi:DNA-binding transcriptional regulator YiaG
MRTVGLLNEIRAARALPAPEVARRIREQAGVSQQRLARELGVTRVCVTRWELGTRRPRGHDAVAYARLLDKLQRELGASE